MASLRSWLGSVLSLAAFLLARRFTAGLAAPSFIVIVFACVYIWTFVLRVPELRDVKPDTEGEAAKVNASAPQHLGRDAADGALKEPRKKAPAEESKGARRAEERQVEEPNKEAPAEHAREPEGASPVEQRRAEEPNEEARTEEAEALPAGARAADAGAAVVTAGGGATAAPGGATKDGPVAGATMPEPEPNAAPVAPDLAHDVAATQQYGVEAAEKKEDDCATGHGPGCNPDHGQGHSGECCSGGHDQESGGGEEHGSRRECDAREDCSNSSDDEDNEQKEGEESDSGDPERAQELRLQGNDYFKAGKLYDAREAYSEAIYFMPATNKKEKAILYSNRAACLQKLARWDDVVSDCKLAVDLDPDYAKAWLRRSTAYEALEKWHDALEDLKKAIELEPAIRSKEYKRQAMLETRAQQQFEKDKDEMMSKLKDLGNTVLGKFGMSTDSFKFEQDPNTGSYSVKYQN